MLTSVFTSIMAYVSTNIDNIFVLMILLASVTGVTKQKLIAGHFLDMGLLGLVTIGLGIKA